MRLIDADVLSEVMYHKAFETDSDMQKWDSGCWIRYKMFENAIDDAPTIEVDPIVRCEDCKWYEWGLTECHNPRYGDGWANYPPPQVYDEYFCKDGERKDEVEK